MSRARKEVERSTLCFFFTFWKSVFTIGKSVSVCEGRGSLKQLYQALWISGLWFKTLKIEGFVCQRRRGTVRGLLQLQRKPQYLSSINSSFLALQTDKISWSLTEYIFIKCRWILFYCYWQVTSGMAHFFISHSNPMTCFRCRILIHTDTSTHICLQIYINSLFSTRPT